MQYPFYLCLPFSPSGKKSLEAWWYLGIGQFVLLFETESNVSSGYFLFFF